MHQSPNIRIPPVFAIHVKDMLPILKRSARYKIYPFNRIDGFSFSIEVFFNNENSVGIRKLLKLLTGMQVLNIQYTGMISCPVGIGSFILSLDFYIIPISE